MESYCFTALQFVHGTESSHSDALRNTTSRVELNYSNEDEQMSFIDEIPFTQSESHPISTSEQMLSLVEELVILEERSAEASLAKSDANKEIEKTSCDVSKLMDQMNMMKSTFQNSNLHLYTETKSFIEISHSLDCRNVQISMSAEVERIKDADAVTRRFQPEEDAAAEAARALVIVDPDNIKKGEGSNLGGTSNRGTHSRRNPNQGGDQGGRGAGRGKKKKWQEILLNEEIWYFSLPNCGLILVYSDRPENGNKLSYSTGGTIERSELHNRMPPPSLNNEAIVNTIYFSGVVIRGIGSEPEPERPWNLRSKKPDVSKSSGEENKGLKEIKSINGEKKKGKKRFPISLSQSEIEDDFMAMVGQRTLGRPKKKRTKIVKNQLNQLFPGLGLAKVTADKYKVPGHDSVLQIVGERSANAVGGGKMIRACDSCLNKRASFYCKADDAFLCQTCDLSVHSANQVARRHERIRLNKTSNLLGSAELDSIGSAPAWHRGFTRKARSTRKSAARTRLIDSKSPLPFVPEINNEDQAWPEVDVDVDVDVEADDDDELLYRVPVFDPFGAENDFDIELNSMLMGHDGNEKLDIQEEENQETCGDDDDDLKNLDQLLESDMDLAEFAADVENLLGKGMDEDDGSGWIKELGLFDQCKKEPSLEIEVQEDDQSQLEVLGSQMEISVPKLESDNKVCTPPFCVTKNKFLRLDHEAVIAAWSSKTSPWADGRRPVFNLEDFVESIFEGGSSSLNQTYGGIHMGNVRINNEGREARVSRYREKRRTRLFSKKIRYEVRKINAEKRPRMKGRFVKRTPTFAGSSPYNNYLMLNK
ncbi:uncharacterized protein LOC124941151 [Impatiens glandulifera]|uniref:uncharacterized protein LOC124941151 n=1 Tax=Impatiens glandulifera TaxID=253017 RepID=UPI001FB172CA|nr:uncharacterized protein LOC124941151 [Impatiens glandulifera]